MKEMLVPSGESRKLLFSGFLKKSRSGMRLAAPGACAGVAGPSVGSRLTGDLVMAIAEAAPAPANAAALERK
jgi:hypothetical protein